MRRAVAWAVGAWLILYSAVASGDSAAESLRHRVDTSGLSGSDLLLATLYNDHRLAYAAVCTLAMAAFGLGIALAMDAVLGRIGLRAGRSERCE